MAKTYCRRKQIKREAAVRDQKGLCLYCKQPMIIAGVQPEHNLMATAEHLVRKQDGGSLGGNIAAAHAICNRRRKRKTVDEHVADCLKLPPWVYPAGAVFWCEEQ